MIALDPNFDRAYFDLAWMYEGMGRFDLAAAIRAEQYSVAGEPHVAKELERAYSISGKEGYLRCLLALQRGYIIKGGNRGVEAITLAQLGEIDEAMGVLEDLYSQRQGDMIFLDVFPSFDPLRADPRFQDLVRRVGIRSR